MAKFHINSKGEPGKCRAFSDNCPFGGEEAHFKSEAQAYEAIAKENNGSFSKPERTTVKRRDWEEVAATSTDEKQLMAVALSLGELGASRKAAAALAKNPAATGEVLKEARSKASLALNDFVDLELHPNYPLDAMTGEGAYKKVRSISPEELKELAKNDGVGDTLLRSISYVDGNDDGSRPLVEAALRNPHNKLSAVAISSAVSYGNRDAADAAAASGRWPNERDISGNDPMNRNKFKPEELVRAAAFTPNEKTARSLVESFGNSPQGAYLYKNIALNKNLSNEFKATLKKEISDSVEELARVRDSMN